jgi:hypothetical protein
MTREPLPQRRRCETISYRVGNLIYQASIGYYPDSRPGEIFLDCSKSGTDVQIAARDSAIVASFALQHGVTSESIRSALTRAPDGSAEGPLGVLLDLLQMTGLPEARAAQ